MFSKIGLSKNTPKNRARAHQPGAIGISSNSATTVSGSVTASSPGNDAAPSAKRKGLRGNSGSKARPGAASVDWTPVPTTGRAPFDSRGPETKRRLRDNKKYRKGDTSSIVTPCTTGNVRAAKTCRNTTNQPHIDGITGSTNATTTTTTMPGTTTMHTLRGLGKNQGPDGSDYFSNNPVPMLGSPPRTLRGLANNEPPRAKRLVPAQTTTNESHSEASANVDEDRLPDPPSPQLDESSSAHSGPVEEVPSVLMDPTGAPPAVDLPVSVPRSNSGLAVARAIDHDPAVLMEAQEVDAEELEKRAIEKKKNKECIIVGLVLIAISLATLFGVIFGTSKTESEDEIDLAPTTVPSLAPSDSPSSAPSGRLDFLLESLPEETRASLTYDTPQLDAWGWLMNHPKITSLKEWRKKQLFALATFYFSFEGENWNELIRDGWMDNKKEECLWFSSVFGRFDEDGNYRSLSPSYDAPSCNEGEEFPSLTLEGLQLLGFAPSMPPEVSLLTSLSAINLGRNDIEASLSDMLPSELGQLNNLTQLFFHDNHLNGIIPTQMGLFTSLTALYLAMNDLTGQLPSELGLIAKIEDLDLRESSFTGQLPSELGLLTNLTQLQLNNNSLTGQLPSELGLMTSLTNLELHRNQLNGSIPSEFGMMTRLHSLHLDGNLLTGAIPTQLIALNSRITFLYLSGNNLTLPTEIGLLTDMASLRIGKHTLKLSVPSEVGLMTSIKHLQLDGNALTGQLPSELGLMTSLTRVDLHSNQFRGPIPSELGRLPQLKDLYLNGNFFNGAIPTQLIALSLSSLDLQGNIDLTLPTEMGLLINVTRVRLEDDSLGSSIPTEVGMMAALQELCLFNNSFKGLVPSEIGLATSMRQIHLSRNRLSGAIPSETCLITTLTQLELHDNSLNGPLPSELGLMANLLQLQLQNNSLTGRLPSEVGLMTSLTQLDLRRNQFGLSVPSQLGMMTSLRQIRLHENTFSGQLPSEVGLMTGTTALLLSHNDLTHKIPSQLALLKKLKHLTLENNHITGAIPTELQSLVAEGSLTSLTLANNSLLGTIPEGLCSLGVFDAGLTSTGMGLSFDCSDQLCGCCWCPCPDRALSNHCITNPILANDEDWPGKFPTVVNGSNAITINIRTDRKPWEIAFGWSALEESGLWKGLEWGSPFRAHALNSYTMEVASDVVYRIRLSDSNGDGVCCGQGLGWFTITSAAPSDEYTNGTIIWDAIGHTLETFLEVFIWIDGNGRAQLVEYIPGDGYALEGGDDIVVPEMSDKNE